MSALLSTFRDRFESRKWLSVALVLGLLLVAYVLPVRLVQQGVSALLLLAALALAVLALPRPWLGLALLLAYGPFATAVRFAGASNLQSLAKDIFALGVVGVWLVDVLMSRRRLERSPLDVLLVLYCALAGVTPVRCRASTPPHAGAKGQVLPVAPTLCLSGEISRTAHFGWAASACGRCCFGGIETRSDPILSS